MYALQHQPPIIVNTRISSPDLVLLKLLVIIQLLYRINDWPYMLSTIHFNMRLNTASQSPVADPIDPGTLCPNLPPIQNIRTEDRPPPTKVFLLKITLLFYNSGDNTIDLYTIWSLFFVIETTSQISVAMNAYACSNTGNLSIRSGNRLISTRY